MAGLFARSSKGKDAPVPARTPLHRLFFPRSVAVLGATATPGTVPYDIFHNILTSGFTGSLYPVSPGKSNICCVRAFRYVVDIPDEIDLAVIVFQANAVDRALEQCGQKGIKSAVVISAGFRETGPAGKKREEKLQSICDQHGIALIGPNCLGVINTDADVALNASFARKMPAAGRIAFLSQSGALCTAVLDYARDKGIGFSKFVSFGNKAGVTEVELLDYLHQDAQTDIILLYLEDLSEGRGLVEAARRITRGENAKPILLIKSGRTEEGSKAAASHTGSLAGSDAVADDVLTDAGIIRVGSIEELFNSAILYAYQPMPKGNRVAIVTNAGGPGVMATDAAVKVGLSIARFAPETTAKLKQALPAAANIHNPVDVIGDARADRYAAALEAVLADANVDQLLVILTPQSMTDIEAIAHAICEVRQHAGKPISCSFMGATDVAAGVHILQAERIPHYILPEWSCRAMADVQRIRSWREQALGEPMPLPVDRATAATILDAAPDGLLAQHQAMNVLVAYGLPVPKYRLCTDADTAVAFADSIGYPVVLQIVSPQVIHKTEVGGVATNLRDASALRLAWVDMFARVKDRIGGAEITGVIVRRMIPPGREVIIGARQDNCFGPVLMFGLGGVAVELFRDVTFAQAPPAPDIAGRMVRRLRSSPLLTGWRKEPAVDLPLLEASLVRVGQLIADFPQIAELDVNPLIVCAGGVAVADVRISLARGSVAA